ncbi:MAG: ParB/RepB/Spo0J family partition protein [Clostridia bacterium]|nr:ParB/RepB/Spo0J family partition protein [Clostridia bacterium]
MYTEERISGAIYLPIENIRFNPYQPRTELDIESIEELCASIKQYGLMQPIVVRQINDRDFELIAGERRLRACRMAGMERIAAIVVRAGGTDSAVMALVENIQREDLGYFEEAQAFCSLIAEHGITQEELARRLGKSQSSVANKIRLLKLSPETRSLLLEYGLGERQARALLRIPDEKSRKRALEIIICRGLNSAKTDELVDGILGKNNIEDDKRNVTEVRIFKDVRIFSNTISKAVDMMKRSGIDAESTKTESEEYIEYTIKIPKNLRNAV